MPMLASVVIPTRNRPTYVYEAVESIFVGQHTDFQVFVVDQSTDGQTEAALDRFRPDSRFRYIRNSKPNVGASSSRNIGIALSTGEIVANIDDDVVARPNFLSTLTSLFESDPALGFVIGRLAAPDYDRTKGMVPEFCPDPSISAWRLPITSAGANYCMRRTVFDKIGGYDECWGPGSKLGVSDDADICFRIIRSGFKWALSVESEVVHVHGFRDNEAAARLIETYEYGNGAVFGRFMRRGDLAAGLWYLIRDVRPLAGAVVRLIRDRDARHFCYIGCRMRGFRRGFFLPPNDKFITPADLDSIRRQYAVGAGVLAFRSPSGQGQNETEKQKLTL